MMDFDGWVSERKERVAAPAGTLEDAAMALRAEIEKGYRSYREGKAYTLEEVMRDMKEI